VLPPIAFTHLWIPENAMQVVVIVGSLGLMTKVYTCSVQSWLFSNNFYLWLIKSIGVEAPDVLLARGTVIILHSTHPVLLAQLGPTRMKR
jgi:hypothetical protein